MGFAGHTSNFSNAVLIIHVAVPRVVPMSIGTKCGPIENRTRVSAMRMQCSTTEPRARYPKDVSRQTRLPSQTRKPRLTRWTRGELNPFLLHAMELYYRCTTGPVMRL